MKAAPRRLAGLALASGALFGGPPALAAPFAWIGTDTSVIAIDVESDRVVATIPMAGRTFVEAAPGRRLAFAIGEDHRHSRVIDTPALAAVATFGEQRGIASFELHPVREEAYLKYASGFPAAPPQAAQVWDTERRAVTAQLPAFSGENLSAVAIDVAGGRGYFQHVDTSATPALHTVLEVDLATRAALRQFALPGPAGHGDVSSTAGRLYVPVPASAAGTPLQQVLVFDLHTGALAGSVNVAASPRKVRLHPSGARLYVLIATLEQPSIVAAVDAATLQVVASISNGSAGRSIDVSPAGDRIYAVNAAEVAVLDSELRTRTTLLTSPSAEGFFARFRFIGGSTPAAQTAAGPATGLWWNPAEPGWGVHLAQRRSTFFAALFHYDAAGTPRWFVAPRCTPNEACPGCVDGVTCTGAIYETGGPAFFLAPFNPAAVQTREAGLLELRFADRDNAHLTYVIAGNHRSLPIRRQVFAPRPALGTDYTDLWWNPLESGWGIGITQQSNVMFLAWFVYDDAGAPAWFVASECAVNAAGNGCRGALYRASGPAGPVPGAAGFDRAALRVTAAGSIELAFTDAHNGMITYTVNGRSGTKPITRQLF